MIQWPKFTCPKCGGKYFGFEHTEKDGRRVRLRTVHCFTPDCNWRGMWPKKPGWPKIIKYPA